MQQFRIAIWGFLGPNERMFALLHELLHIPYALAGIPKVALLTREEHGLLEDSIDWLMDDTVFANPELPDTVWEKLCGFRSDDFSEIRR